MYFPIVNCLFFSISISISIYGYLKYLISLYFIANCIGELITPTGAAVLKALCNGFHSPPTPFYPISTGEGKLKIKNK